MSIATYTEFLRRLQSPDQLTEFIELIPSTPGNGRYCSSWASAPGAAAVPSQTAADCVGQFDGGSGKLRLIGIGLNNAASPGLFLLMDRLSHSSGMSGTVTSAQTTNLPTAALTRYTTGAGVLGFLEVYASVGTTATTATVSYTNQAGTAGRTSPAFTFGSTNFREQNTMVPIPLQAGDTGIRAVASVTLAGTTGTVGDFGVTLVRPLHMIQAQGEQRIETWQDPVLGRLGALGIPEVVDGSALFVVAVSPALSGGTIYAMLSFAED